MEINKILIEWYRKEGRDLPWRNTSNPYNIWVSEIILQQTRVDQGRAYYKRFLEIFPDVFSLARADIDEVLKVWQGLGYYSRARNMHHTAGLIVSDYHGQFPGNYQNLLKLKGIGPYTAAAISSIAFNEVVPAVDGNVKRVMSRLFGIEKDIKSAVAMEDVRNILHEIIDNDQPGIFNQALMDLGALVCTPVSPSCSQCPLKAACFAFQHNKTSQLPVNIKNTRIRKRYFYYCVIREGDNVYLEQRKGKDIWHLLYQFPLIEAGESLSEEEILERIQDDLFKSVRDIKIDKISGVVSHQLSHQKIIARFIHLRSTGGISSGRDGNPRIVPLARLDEFPIPRLIERYIEENPV